MVGTQSREALRHGAGPELTRLDHVGAEPWPLTGADLARVPVASADAGLLPGVAGR